MRPETWVRIAALSLVALTTAACQTNSATGRSQLLFMSAAQEQQIGDEQHPKLVKTFGGEFDDRGLDQYVTGVGKQLDVFAETENVTYSYTVLDSEIANAFALPGGYVHISRGLLALMNNEAELASVLAHEVGHITGRHSAERYSRGTLAQVGVLGAAILSGSSEVAQLASTGAQLYVAGYSRGQESESDRLGLRYMNNAGYDPSAMGTMLAQLGRNSDTLAKAAGREASQQFDMLSTHPQTPQRIRDADAAAATIVEKGTTVRRDAFLSQIDGMPWGPSRQVGAIRGQRYGNLVDGIIWEAPSDFKLAAGSGGSVGAVLDNKALAEYDTIQHDSSVSPLNYLTGVWGQKYSLLDVETVDVNGLPGATGVLREVRTNRGIVDIRAMVIGLGNNKFGRFLLTTDPQYTAEVDRTLQRLVYSYRRIRSSERAQFEPLRIDVVTVRSGDTVGRLASRMKVDKLAEEWFRTINGLGPNEGLIAGQKVKLVVNG